MKSQIFLIIAIIAQVSIVHCIELELSQQNYFQACTVLLSSFDPVKVQLKIPKLPNKIDQQTFSLKLSLVTDRFHQTSIDIGDDTTFRKQYQLEKNIPYNLCINFNAMREMETIKPIYIKYSAIEDFQNLIGQIQIPKQLASEENLKTIYHIGGELKQISTIIKGHQLRQRKLEDQIATKNVHKEKRIVTLGLIEVCVIVLCGVYQIFALRKFLIEKNLY